jgi:hypothetical protein
MKIPNYDHSEAKWDDLRRFHNAITLHHSDWRGAVVRLDTGEMFIRSMRFSPYLRRRYEQYGFTIVSTRDYKCPRLYDAQGNLIPGTHLTQGRQQVLLIDHDSPRVIALEQSGRPEREPVEWGTIPADLRNSRALVAWWSGDAARPIARKIAVSVPAVLDPAERQHALDLRTTAQAWVAMTEDRRQPGMGWPPGEVKVPFDKYGRMSFEDLPDPIRKRLAASGWKWPRAITYHQYLYTSQEHTD